MKAIIRDEIGKIVAEYEDYFIDQTKLDMKFTYRELDENLEIVTKGVFTSDGGVNIIPVIGENVEIIENT